MERQWYRFFPPFQCSFWNMHSDPEMAASFLPFHPGFDPFQHQNLKLKGVVDRQCIWAHNPASSPPGFWDLGSLNWVPGALALFSSQDAIASMISREHIEAHSLGGPRAYNPTWANQAYPRCGIQPGLPGLSPGLPGLSPGLLGLSPRLPTAPMRQYLEGVNRSHNAFTSRRIPRVCMCTVPEGAAKRLTIGL